MRQFIWCKTGGRDIKIGDEKRKVIHLIPLSGKVSRCRHMVWEWQDCRASYRRGRSGYLYLCDDLSPEDTTQATASSRINFLEDCTLDHNQDQRGFSAGWSVVIFADPCIRTQYFLCRYSHRYWPFRPIGEYIGISVLGPASSCPQSSKITSNSCDCKDHCSLLLPSLLRALCC